MCCKCNATFRVYPLCFLSASLLQLPVWLSPPLAVNCPLRCQSDCPLRCQSDCPLHCQSDCPLRCQSVYLLPAIPSACLSICVSVLQLKLGPRSAGINDYLDHPSQGWHKHWSVVHQGRTRNIYRVFAMPELKTSGEGKNHIIFS
jgi:hypothetical protein